MNELTFEEKNLVCIYNESGTRRGVIDAMREMRTYLDPGETEMRALTDSALDKLEQMSDAEYAALDLFPDFTTEEEEETANLFHASGPEDGYGE